MVGFHTAATPPHPPPNVTENAPSTSMEVFLKQRSGQCAVKSVCWIAALAEVAVIISTEHPESWLFKKTLTLLVPLPGSQENIHLSPLFLLGTLMASLGGCIRWYCYRALGNLFTFEMSIRNEHKLVTDGPYGVVRHPGYSGILLAVIGIIFWHASPGSWARECGIFQNTLGRIAGCTYLALTTTILFGLISRMAAEDAALRRVFGVQWDDWARRVPYKLIPWVI
ncbi:hypothetical protein BDN70DRAFT_797737 [Pholiota conissans]|uniref:Protein-S-isoprenylcysteine O-methyltransferase n=1 Tax=Pholiota conissans TaxID=109636 RepID=A0A9P6CXR8_9AGAR|nr:hypothetical protein BDN70DRAFT_797737 [Pholiota conissans]